MAQTKSRLVFTTSDPRDEPIEWENVFINPPANGLTAEEISWDEFLIAREEQAKKEKQREFSSEELSSGCGDRCDHVGAANPDNLRGHAAPGNEA